MFLVFINCKTKNQCLIELKINRIEGINSDLKISFIEYDDGNWKNIEFSESEPPSFGRFSYKIAVDSIGRIISINGIDSKNKTQKILMEEYNKNVEKFALNNNWPYASFEIQTFNYPVVLNKNGIINILCYLHEIISLMKEENLDNKIDEKLIEHFLSEKYMIYEYYDLHDKEGYMPIPKYQN